MGNSPDRTAPDEMGRWTSFCKTILALIFLAIGLSTVVGGVWLAVLGGSLYYLLAGIALAVVGALIWMRDGRAGVVYTAFLAATIAWALWEVGADGWSLLPRLLAPAVLGLTFLLPGVRPPWKRGFPVIALSLATIMLLAATLWPTRVSGSGTPAQLPSDGGDGGWPFWGSDAGGSRFSTMTQLTPSNVSGLEEAWTYRVGVPPDGRLGNLEVTPIMVGGRLFICNNMSMVDAIDPETGRRLWRFDPHADVSSVASRTCRGVAFATAPGTDCPERIIATTLDARLFALDARTGRPCPAFGTNGSVDLKRGMGPIEPGGYYPTSAPTIVNGHIVIGGWVTDGERTLSASGVVRAYSVIDGAFEWAWDMGRPGDAREPGEGATYTLGTPNAWAPMSADARLGLVYIPTGNSTPDYFSAHRSAESNRFNSSVVALDVATGSVRWAYQTVHRDVWDYDVPAQPTLIEIGGVPALLQATKQGRLFLLDRRTGRPLHPVREQAVPAGGAPGERLSPTQPLADRLPEFSGPPLTEARMWGVTPLDQLWCRIAFRRARYDGIFTPPGLQPSIEFPGFMGAINWGGVSVDPRRGIAYVNSMRIPTWHQLIPRQQAEAMGLRTLREGGGRMPGYRPQGGIPYAVEAHGFLSPLGVPCSAPPYGMLTAVDLRTGQRLWERPLGTARDSGPLGIRSNLPIDMGLPNIGGSTATAGGLLFIAATQEQSIRAVDASNGAVLWTARLPAGGQATPMTYRSPTSGRQFVVIAAGGKPLLQTKTGDYLVAYALPKRP